MENKEIIIEDLGPAVRHNMPCAVWYNSESALFNMNLGVFEPSWKAQEQGYCLVHAKSKFQKWLVKTFFEGSL